MYKEENKQQLQQPPRLTRCFTDKEIAIAIEEGRILSLSIKLPCGCNLKCKYCYSQCVSDGLPFIKWEEVLKEASLLGLRSVSIIGAGEPLLYRDRATGKNVIDIIRAANSFGISVVLFTNNTCIDDACAQELFACDVTVVGKMNSSRGNVQDLLVGVPHASKKMQHGLRSLIEAGFTQDKSRLSIHTVVCHDNYYEIKDLWISWREANIIPYVQVFVPPKNNNKIFIDELSVTKEKMRQLFYSLADVDRDFGYAWDPDYTYPIAALGCSVVKTGCCIDIDGSVHMCGYLDEPLGSVERLPLKNILDLVTVQKIRKKKYPQSVSGKPHFYGCRASAYNITGNRFNADPLFWKRAT